MPFREPAVCVHCFSAVWQFSFSPRCRRRRPSRPSSVTPARSGITSSTTAPGMPGACAIQSGSEFIDGFSDVLAATISSATRPPGAITRRSAGST